jgi:hypothetical protein
MEGTMTTSIVRWGWLALACCAFTACKDRREPVKPTTGGAALQVQVR